MECSTIKDGNQYLLKLHDALDSSDMIDMPKVINQFAILSYDKKGNLIAWQIDNQNVQFIDGSFLKASEKAVLEGDRFHIKKISHHFNHIRLNSYRIDFDKKGLHLNPDSKLESTLGHYISADKLYVDIRNFNCLLSIHLALLYIQHEIYPALIEARCYNNKLNGIRRLIP